MEFVLKVFTQRNCAADLALFGLLCAAGRLQPYCGRWYRDWRYPPQKSASAGGDEIMALLEDRASSQLIRRHERVMTLLARARTAGFSVSLLERKADVAMKLNDPRNRAAAVKILAEIEMGVPRKRARYLPLSTTDENMDIPEDIPGRRVRGRR